MILNPQPPNTNINIPIAKASDPIKHIEEQYHGKIIDFVEFKESHPKLFSWIEVLMKWENSFKKSFIIVKHTDEDIKSENRIGIYLYTSEYEYKISARKPGLGLDDNGYLGCIASTRKNRAGEQWNRGSDMHDGSYSKETFDRILVDIVAYELVKQEAL